MPIKYNIAAYMLISLPDNLDKETFVSQGRALNIIYIVLKLFRLKAEGTCG